MTAGENMTTMVLIFLNAGHVMNANTERAFICYSYSVEHSGKIGKKLKEKIPYL
jgi:hypothetical protein